MLTLNRNDFRIQASRFDLTKGSNILRIVTGAFILPHIAAKFADGTFNPSTLGFFVKAGLTPPEFWVGLATMSEFLVGVFLVLGLCTRFAALGGIAVMLIAAYTLLAVNGFVWVFNAGGCEYPVFLAINCALVALDAWKTYFAERDGIPASGRMNSHVA